MQIILTLDYELFMGSSTGTVDKCLVEPMRRLCQAIEPAQGRFTIFVDACYLLKLQEYSSVYNRAASDLNMITSHLRQLSDAGHDLQLHIHPHWWFSTFDGMRWNVNSSYYKMSDVPDDTLLEMFRAAKALLEDIKGKPVRVFRAGGFSAQPTELLTRVFEATGLDTDMSVCPGAVYDSAQQQYDYTRCPDKAAYRFSQDLCVEDSAGKFLEIPISTHPVSPLFHWRLALSRVLRLKAHQTFGDGQSIPASSGSVFRRLFTRVPCIVTIDGMKIDNLFAAHSRCHRRGGDLLCVIGHPKLATPYSVDRLSVFCSRLAKQGDKIITASQLHYES